MLMCLFGIIFGLYVLITDPSIPIIFDILYVCLLYTDVFTLIVGHIKNRDKAKKKHDKGDDGYDGL